MVINLLALSSSLDLCIMAISLNLLCHLSIYEGTGFSEGSGLNLLHVKSNVSINSETSISSLPLSIFSLEISNLVVNISMGFSPKGS